MRCLYLQEARKQAEQQAHQALAEADQALQKANNEHQLRLAAEKAGEEAARRADISAKKRAEAEALASKMADQAKADEAARLEAEKRAKDVSVRIVVSYYHFTYFRPSTTLNCLMPTARRLKMPPPKRSDAPNNRALTRRKPRLLCAKLLR